MHFLENMGLGFLAESEESISALWSYIVQNGNRISGYYGLPYINCECGSVQFVLRTALGEDGKYEIVGMDTQARGRSVWDVCLDEVNLTPKTADKLEHCRLVHRPNGEGCAVIHIINGDVLPGFEEGEEVKLQVTAFPAFIEYYEDEEAYMEAQPKQKDGKTWIISEGFPFPAGLFANGDPESDAFEKGEEPDDLMLIRGTVKKLWLGTFEIDGKKHNTFIRCLIDTDFGELQIAHTLKDVKKEQWDNLREGATVYGAFRIVGDAAIYEHEEGIVLDEDHDLAILRSVLSGGDAERMRCVFAEDAVYVSECSKLTFKGRDDIIARLNFVSRENETVYAKAAIIAEADEGETPLPYTVGRRCIVISYGEEEEYAAIAFADIDEEGRISRLFVTSDERYTFALDEKPLEVNSWEDLDFQSPFAFIIMRARLHGIIGERDTEETVFNGMQDEPAYRRNIEKMLSAMPEKRERAEYENLFGYLFAKEVETVFAEKQAKSALDGRMLVSYVPEEAWRGEMQTNLPPELHEKAEEAMKLGKLFAHDFAMAHPLRKPHGDDFDFDLLQALILVQQMGRLYAQRLCLRQ